MADELDARLIGKREINLIARLYLLQIFLEMFKSHSIAWLF